MQNIDQSINSGYITGVSLKKISTADQAIDALGGTFAVARLFGVDPGVVSAWRRRGLPAKSYCAMQALLRAKGYRVSENLFNMLKARPHP